MKTHHWIYTNADTWALKVAPIQKHCMKAHMHFLKVKHAYVTHLPILHTRAQIISCTCRQWMKALLHPFSFIQPFSGLFAYAGDLEMSQSRLYTTLYMHKKNANKMFVPYRHLFCQHDFRHIHRHCQTFRRVHAHFHHFLLYSLVNQCHNKSEAWGVRLGGVINSSGLWEGFLCCCVDWSQVIKAAATTVLSNPLWVLHCHSISN